MEALNSTDLALNNADLKRYVRALFDLESSVYSQNQRIDAFASFVQRKVQSYAPSEVPKELGGGFFAALLLTLYYFGAFLICGGVIVAIGVIAIGIILLVANLPKWLAILTGQFSLVDIMFGWVIALWNEWIIPYRIVLLSVLGVAFVVTVIFLTKDMRDTDKRTLEEIRLISAENAIKQRLGIEFSNSANEKLYEMQQMRNETMQLLSDYYSLGQIHEKYRGLVPMASICEYIESGSCDTLKEAYNKFDLESRLGTIISKLDIVIAKLDSIAANQHLLYYAIEESNRGISSMVQRLNSLSDKVDIVALNSANAAFDARITATNSEWVKWYAFYSSTKR